MILIYSTFPDRRSARKVVKLALEKKIAACANLWPIDAIFAWEGKISQEKEWAVLFKTTSANLQQLRQLIIDNHPYSAPAILSWSAKIGHKDYKKWLNNYLK